MTTQTYPIYTTPAQCCDCYKCVRKCPVKAIRIEGGFASVRPERCVACGQCVKVCPNRAKKVRSDVSRFFELAADDAPLYVSLAPSWSGVFADWTKDAMIAAFKTLGVREVSETALGAQEVSAALARDLSNAKNGVFVSSACPAVVDYIRRYYPDETSRITPIASPALTHCALLRRIFGSEIRIAFVGPCAAKKNEADRNPDLLDVALTFDELRAIFAEKELKPEDFEGVREKFAPESAAEGAIYPLEGGALETIRRCGCDENVLLQSTSGLQILGESLANLRTLATKRPVFIEALACPGGCVNGPCATRTSWLGASTGVLQNATLRDACKREPTLRVEMKFPPDPVAPKRVDESELREALRSVGKTSPNDELNCGGCGYDSCREFATALARGDAETRQCVSYMRQIATRKANALLTRMPAGVAILDENLLIVESNEAFSRIFGEEIEELYRVAPGLEGADVTKILPCAPLFEAVLRSGEDVRRDSFPIGDQLLDLTIFTIEPSKIIGVVVQDVTATEMNREQIARRAEEVISRNISIVQEIACKLGEHMADTEIILNSIAKGYRTKTEAARAFPVAKPAPVSTFDVPNAKKDGDGRR